MAKKSGKAVSETLDNDDALPFVQAAVALCLEKKATDPIILRVTSLTSYTDYFVVASAPSERQVAAIAAHLEEMLKKAGVRTLGVEGKGGGNWVLLDFGDFVVHLFFDEAREYYDLEGFWADAPRVEVDETFGLEVLKSIDEQAAQKKTA